MSPRYAMTVDTRRCVGCHACVYACKSENALPEKGYRDWIEVETRGRFPDLTQQIRSERCKHCEHPPCVSACPTGASHVGEGGTVLVTNGEYRTGGALTPGGQLMNRVAVTNPITVRSVNGPFVTSIVGAGPLGGGAVRCVWLGDAAVLSGFAIEEGHTQTDGDWERDMCGGGVWGEGAQAVVTNCVLRNNAAEYDGGGAYRCTLLDGIGFEIGHTPYTTGIIHSIDQALGNLPLVKTVTALPGNYFKYVCQVRQLDDLSHFR